MLLLKDILKLIISIKILYAIGLFLGKIWILGSRSLWGVGMGMGMGVRVGIRQGDED